MQATWSDMNSNESDSMASKDQRYERNEFLFLFFLAFVVGNPQITSFSCPGSCRVHTNIS